MHSPQETSATSANPMEETERILFELLRSRGIAKIWASTTDPRSALATECRNLLTNTEFKNELAIYLSANPSIARSREAVLSQLAFAAGVRWQSASELLRPLAERGAHMSRWLPTFLLVNGPIGRFLKQSPSPLVDKLKSQSASFPLLCDARKAFNHDLFRKVRNGFAHWCFAWKSKGTSLVIEVFDETSGATVAEILQLEAEALHYLSASVVQIIDEELLRKVIPNGG